MSHSPDLMLKRELLRVPQSADVSLDAGNIVWPAHLYERYRQRRPPGDLLLQFVALHDQNEDAFLRFARTYGCLELCSEHEMPACHYWDCPASGCESVARWRALSEQAFSILEIRDVLKEGGVASAKSWAAALEIAEFVQGPLSWPWRARLRAKELRSCKKYGMKELGRAVQAWLEIARIGPAIIWDEEHKQHLIELRPADHPGSNLFVYLTWELMREACGIARIGICSSCKQPYSRGRKGSNAAGRNYCSNCGRKAAVRLATQRWRERQGMVRGKGNQNSAKKKRSE